MEYPEGTQGSASTCICVKALKSFLTMSLLPHVPGTIRGILSFPSLLSSATTFSSSEQYHGDLFQKEREKFNKKIHVYTK